METEEGGKKAIEELNGKTLPDSEPDSEKPLIVSESKNPEGPNLATIKLKVTNLSPLVKADALRSLFTPYGLVLKVKVAAKKRANPDACRSGIVVSLKMCTNYDVLSALKIKWLTVSIIVLS